MFVNLSEEVTEFISNKASEYISKKELNVPIGTEIFSELKRVSILLLYPLFDENANGICVTRTVKNKKEKFIYINTNNNITKQVYTAAHEIGHIIDIDKELKKEIEFNDDPELIINRFASELLMPKKDFIQMFIKTRDQLFGLKTTIKVDDINKLIFELMLHFMVPYRAICYRMGELSILSNDDVNWLEKYERKNKDDIEKTLRNNEKYSVLVKTDRNKEFGNIKELINKADDNNLTFKTKINRIRELFDSDVQQKSDITIQDFEV